ncbi:hypothetical protein [Methylocapsa palsarum]|uniref:Uncharacterized protein n=1 Tax=Methylocapsa palsarum TaxID=1612308 RepID=A0A1I4DGJ7_9HYPH|nr:hypothetical protein [Methylocapsa palsarum]SFK92203.1 hypothetical protein SAMN05444581_1642 [Methylocapsa palsarum]
MNEQRPAITIDSCSDEVIYEIIARKITKADPPAWLVASLKRWGPGVIMSRAIAAWQPTRAEMKQKLQGVKNAAQTLIVALNDGAIRGFLDEAPQQIPYHGQMDMMLRDLVRRADESVGSLVTKDGRTKAGRNKAMPRRASHPKTECAALIAEAWLFIHGVDPVPKNREAATAAEMLWTGSVKKFSLEPVKTIVEGVIVQETKSWGDKLSGWRHHFKLAKDPALANFRQEFRRHLNEDRHRSNLHAGEELE